MKDIKTTAAEQVKAYIQGFPEGKPFCASALWRFASTENIRQIMHRLVKAGQLKRVGRGIFVRPNCLSGGEEVLPSITEIAAVLAEATGETIVLHGAEAARQLHLTTQVPMRWVFYTSGNTRILKIANRTVKLRHVNPSRLIAPGTTEGLVFSALLYLGRKNVNIGTLELIKRHISSEKFQAIMNLREHMPTWMADVFYHYQQKQKYE